MIEARYREIAAACDRLLRADDTSLARLAIPLLHVVDGHPSHLGQYRHMSDDRLSEQLPLPSTNALKIVARCIHALLRSASARSVRWSGPRPADVLLVSRAVSAPSGHADFYFGDMQRWLAEGGAACATIAVARPRVTLLREARIWGRCLLAHFRLLRRARSASTPMEHALAELASAYAVAGSTAENLRLHEVVRKACGLLNPRIVITTYEGSASERLIWHASRCDGRRPLCVGYQHTRILANAHAIRRSIATPALDCDPDVVLTLGAASHRLLAASPALTGTRLVLYGSHRRVHMAPPTPLPDRPRRCLVLPDASAGECAILFDLAVACARLRPDVEFTLRPHPATDLAWLRSQHEWLRDLPVNASFSTHSTLAEDCARSRYCLYRGSSAVFHAVLCGLKPFYVTRPQELAFDPLHAAGDWRETVESPDALSARMLSADQEPDTGGARRAWTFCDRSIAQVRPEALDELLRLSGFRARNSPRLRS